jgi:acetate kinase
MNVLALNCGSSSVKFRLLTVDPDADVPQSRALAGGSVDRLGASAHVLFEGDGRVVRAEAPVASHEEAVDRVLRWLAAGPAHIDAVGHRVVHGGARFAAPTLIDDAVIAAVEALDTLAPLHNRLPERTAHYAIPWDLARRHGIRRFGFHGLSYVWASARAAALLGRPVEQTRLVVLHLGSGCSAAAIRGGLPVDTSMGLTPLEGLVMGTRSGDLDPALPGFLARAKGVDVAEVESWLNQRSGLLGLAGGSGDARDLPARESHDHRARLALEVFCHRVRKYLGAYLAALEGADAVVFTGGMGAHSPEIRARIVAGFEWCGLDLDDGLNRAALGVETAIGADSSAIRALVIPADEERVIARETAACLTYLGTLRCRVP